MLLLSKWTLTTSLNGDSSLAVEYHNNEMFNTKLLLAKKHFKSCSFVINFLCPDSKEAAGYRDSGLDCASDLGPDLDQYQCQVMIQGYICDLKETIGFHHWIRLRRCLSLVTKSNKSINIELSFGEKVMSCSNQSSIHSYGRKIAYFCFFQISDTFYTWRIWEGLPRIFEFCRR